MTDNLSGLLDKTVFHGSTTRGVVELTPQCAVEVRGAVFFTDNEEVAQQYRYEREYGEIVGEQAGDLVHARLNLSNPLVVDFEGDVGEAIRLHKLIEQAKAAGHDGLIILNVDDSVDSSKLLGTSYAVFDAAAIQIEAILSEEEYTEGDDLDGLEDSSDRLPIED